jgi:RHS repeat-associated protein
VLAYGYDAAGNVLSRADTINGQAAGTTSYAYDALDRMTQVSQTGPGVTAKRVDFAYDAVGEMTGITRYADLAGTLPVAASQYTYDKGGRLTALTDRHGNTTLAAYTWTYDAASRITAATTPDGHSTYNYDKTGQLTAAVHAGQADESYSYDANGNRTSTGYKTGPDNEVLSDGTFNYAYDAEGNLIRQTNMATGAVTDYTYDYRNRLTEVTFKDGAGNVLKDVTYAYDVFNNRIGETVTAGATTTVERFVYDGSQVALTFDGNGNLTHRYLYGPLVDQVLADDNGQGQVLWTLTDDLGSVRDIIDSSGTIQDHIIYDSFGNITSQTNAAIDFLFAYTGQQLDRASGLYYDQARYYNAALGRFISQDPLGFSARDTNLYRYVGNDSINLTDPTGKDCPSEDDPIPELQSETPQLDTSGSQDNQQGVPADYLYGGVEANVPQDDPSNFLQGSVEENVSQDNGLQSETAQLDTSNFLKGSVEVNVPQDGTSVQPPSTGSVSSGGTGGSTEDGAGGAVSLSGVSGQGTIDTVLAARRQYWKEREQAIIRKVQEDFIKEVAGQIVSSVIPYGRIAGWIGKIPGVGPLLGKLGSAIGGRIAQAAARFLTGRVARLGGSVLDNTALKSAPISLATLKATNIQGATAFQDSLFSVRDWTGYPRGVPVPKGPFRLLKGNEYDAARKAANAANAALRRADPAKYAGKEIHEIHPVKFGGSPTDPANKIALTPQEHAEVTTWWNRLMRWLR